MLMKSLSQIFEAADCESVKTYIQSGNVVFNARVRTAIASNPYPQAVSEPKSLHLCFLDEPPLKAQVRDAEGLLSDSESIAVIGSLLYLHAPDRVARSKFANGIDRVFRRNTTARNWRTVTKLADLATTIE